MVQTVHLDSNKLLWVYLCGASYLADLLNAAHYKQTGMQRPICALKNATVSAALNAIYNRAHPLSSSTDRDKEEIQRSHINANYAY